MNQPIEEKWNWQEEFDKEFPPAVVKKEFVDALNEVLGTVGKYVPETATEVVIAQNAENSRLRVKSFIENLLEQEKKRMSDEVGKLENDAEEVYSASGCDYSDHVDKESVMAIINK